MDLAFVVDGMLGSLARKLRMYGFDTLYYADADDDKIISIGRQSGRVIVTCDRGLFEAGTKHGVASVLLTDPSDEERLITVFRTLKLRPGVLEPEATRCPVCNGLLEVGDAKSVQVKVPRGVAESYTEFYVCRECGKVYWQGSHWKRILDLSTNVRRKLRQA